MKAKNNSDENCKNFVTVLQSINSKSEGNEIFSKAFV